MYAKKNRTLSLKVPWGHVAAKTWGDSNSTPVLMVHGILDNAGSFDRLIQLLPDNFYYVCIDLPGHGLSSHFPAGLPLNYIAYLLVLRYVLDILKWEHAYYIGHSFGAHLGFLFALVYPERIRKLILIDGIIPKPIEKHQLLSRIRLEHDITMQALELKSSFYTEDDILFAFKTMRKSCLNSNAAKALFERGVSKINENSYCYNRDLRGKIKISPVFNLDQSLYLIRQLKVETLIFFASNSLPFLEFLKPHFKSILNKLKHVKLVDIEGNHDIHNNYPERIADYVLEFLNSIPSKL